MLHLWKKFYYIGIAFEGLFFITYIAFVKILLLYVVFVGIVIYIYICCICGNNFIILKLHC